MVEEVVKKDDVEATDTSDVKESSSDSDVKEKSSAQGDEALEASKSQSEQQEGDKPLADGTDPNKPISYKDARRMAETAAEKAVGDYKTQFEEDERLATEDEDDLGEEGLTPPVPGKEDPLMAKFLAPFPKDQWDSLKPSYQPMVDEMNAQKRETALVKQVTGDSLKKQFYARYSDLKEGSQDAKLVENLVIRKGYDPDDAYKLVMKTPEKMKTQLEAEIATKNKKLNQVKKDSNTVGGASGTQQGGIPGLPTKEEGSDEWFDAQARKALGQT